VLALSHSIVSVAIGDKISNPTVAFTLAFFAHFICDSFLHWNFFPHKHKPIAFFATIDVIIGLFASYLLLGNNFCQWSVFAAIIGGLLPDIVAFTALFLKIELPFFTKFHDKIQRETESIWKGLISQIIVIAISLIFVFSGKLS
jgi:hypothetical protein